MPILEQIARSLETTRQRCLDLRNARYPVSEWPDVIHRQTLAGLGRSGAVLLEIGCGRDATDLQQLATHYDRAVGLDFEIARQGPPAERWRVIRADGQRLPIGAGSVDVVAMADVVEHLEDPVAAFRQCFDVLRPGGYFVATTVNQWFPPTVLGRILPHAVRQKVNYLLSATPQEDTFPAYYRANSAQRLTGCAKAAGFGLVQLRYLSHHPRYLMFSYPVYRFGVSCEQIVRRHDAFRGVRQFLHGVFQRPEAVKP